MQVAARPYVTPVALLATASLVAGAPIAQRAIHLPTLSIETQPVDSSIVNIPFNLFQEIVNIPSNEVDAMTYAAESLFNNGPWFVVSNTNLWGVDPGDPKPLHVGGELPCSVRGAQWDQRTRDRLRRGPGSATVGAGRRRAADEFRL